MIIDVRTFEKGLEDRGFDLKKFRIKYSFIHGTSNIKTIIISDKKSREGIIAMYPSLEGYELKNHSFHTLKEYAAELGLRSAREIASELFTPETLKYFDRFSFSDDQLTVFLADDKTSNTGYFTLYLDKKLLQIDFYTNFVYKLRTIAIAIMKELDQKGWKMTNSDGARISSWKKLEAGATTIEEKIASYIQNNYPHDGEMKTFINRGRVRVAPRKDHPDVFIYTLKSQNYISFVDKITDPETLRMIDDIIVKWNIKTTLQLVESEISPTFAKLVEKLNGSVDIRDRNDRVEIIRVKILKASGRYAGDSLLMDIYPFSAEVKFYDEVALEALIKVNPQITKEMFKELDVLGYELVFDRSSDKYDITLWLDL